MTEWQFTRELEYQISLSVVESMKRSGLIDDTDYEKWCDALLRKYDPPLGKIVSNRQG